MQDRDKVQEMLKQGKINSDQAVLLLRALKEGAQRRERIFKTVLEQRQTRERKAWGFIGLWFVLMLVLAMGLTMALRARPVTRNARQAMQTLDQAAIHLAQAEYQAAADLANRAVRQAPRFVPAYTTLAAAYQGLYQETGEARYQDEARSALDQGRQRAAQDKEGAMNGTAIFFFVIFLVLLLGVISTVLLVMYNLLVRREERVNESWAQVETLCQRKVDLIPALLEVVNNYCQHEQETLQGVIRARAQAEQLVEELSGLTAITDAQLHTLAQAQANLAAGLGKVNALAEQYPDLKANVHYQTMLAQLQETEDAVTSARQWYNRCVRSYNGGLKAFPFNVLAEAFKFQPRAYFAENQA